MTAHPKPQPRERRRLAPGRTLAAPTVPMRAISPKRAALYVDARPIRAAVRQGNCAVREVGGFTVPPCMGAMTTHEVWPRGRGGPIDDPRNIVGVCQFHNEWLSQTVEGQAFGEVNGLLVRAKDGAAWLAAGGVLQ